MRRALRWVFVAAVVACDKSDRDVSELSASAGEERAAADTESGNGSADARSGSGGAPRDAGAASNGGASSDASLQGAGGSAGAVGSDAAAGAAGSGAAAGGSAGQAGTADPCPKPAGTDLTVSEYPPPGSALGCDFEAASTASVTLASEAEFLELFSCPQGAASGIDFVNQRLRVSVIREAGFIAPTRHHAVLTDGVVQIGLQLPPYCGGAFPPNATVFTLVPSGDEPVEEVLCRPGNCGAGGFPP